MSRLVFPFANRVNPITQGPDDSASTSTLSSMTSAAARLHFTEDTESYVQSPPPIPPGNDSTNANGNESTERPRGLARVWTLRKHDSTSTLVSDEPSFKKTDERAVIVDTTPRLIALRARLAAENLDYFVIPSEDAHISDYVADSDRRLRWTSGFTGSAGTVIVSKHSAYLFVDPRYWVQAGREIDSNWTICKTGTPEITDWLDWVIKSPRGCRVGIDSRMISHEHACWLSKGLYDRGSKLIYPRQNLVDLVWQDKPRRPADHVYVQPIEFAGREAKEKLSEIRRWIRKQDTAYRNRSDGGPNAALERPRTPLGRAPTPNSITTETPIPPSAVPAHLASSYPVVERANATPGGSDVPPRSSGLDKLTGVFISDLASIAYALNLRGSDIPFLPVFTAYLLVGVDGKTVLFIEGEKVSGEVKGYLHENGVSIREYSDVWLFLRAKQWGEGKIIISPNTPYTVSLITGSQRYVVLPSYIEEVKAMKNEVEIQGMRNAYIRDGVAMVRWFAWLEHKLRQGYEITEWEASEKLNSFREDETREGGLPMYMGLARENIVASGANAALPHSTQEYRDGTCDTTRTVHFGFPSVEQAETFTRVLQGHIAIETSIFPSGTSGVQLDILARRMLWRDGQNYLHGTGHGIGSFLSIYEGPHSFSSSTPLQPGHVLTNAPGIYKEGKLGVRIGSTIVVREVQTKYQSGADKFYAFERLTQVPIQMKMVRPSLLSMEEQQWVIDHNASVRRYLEPYLQDDRRALKWLRQGEKALGNEGSKGRTIEWD